MNLRMARTNEHTIAPSSPGEDATISGSAPLPSAEPFSRLIVPRAYKSDTIPILRELERSLPIGIELHRGYQYVLPLGKGKKLSIIVVKLHCPESLQDKLDEWRSTTASQFDMVTILTRQVKGDQNIQNNLQNTFRGISKLTDEHLESIDSLVDSLCGTPPESPILENICHTQREDLTSIPFVAIDREGTRDIEDLIHGERKQGGILVWRTAFIDATDYIQPGDPIDRYAMRVASTIYGRHRTIPTLGSELSHDLLSFLPQQVRPAWVIEARLIPQKEITPEGKRPLYRYTLSYKVRRGMVSNKQSIDPSQVATVGEDPLIARSFSALADIARILHQRRASRKSLFRVDGEGAVSQILAEIMIESKRLLSDFLGNQRKIPMIYRVHQKPSSEVLEHFHQTLDELGIPNKPGDFEEPQEFAGILQSLEERRDEKSRSLLNNLIDTFLLRTQFSSRNAGHYGLRLDAYAEFKPRDASGLTNQYQLDAAFENERLLNEDIIENRAEQLNEKRWRRDEKTYKLRFYEMLRERLVSVGSVCIGTVIQSSPFRTYVDMEGFSKWGILENRNGSDVLEPGSPVVATLTGFDLKTMRFTFEPDKAESVLPGLTESTFGLDQFKDVEF